MTHEEIMIQNMNMVIEKSLDLFYYEGIFNTSIAQIAQAAGLTPTSVYRYFHDKDTIVINAASLFARRFVTSVKNHLNKAELKNLSGYEQCEVIMNFFLTQVRKHKRLLVICSEFEHYLSSIGIIQKGLMYNPITNPDLHNGVTIGLDAIKKGMYDGTIRTDMSAEHLHELVKVVTFGALEKIAEQFVDWTEENPGSFPEYLFDGYSNMILEYINKK